MKKFFQKTHLHRGVPMQMRARVAAVASAGLGLTLLGFANNSRSVTTGMTTGEAKLQSAGALALGPGGVIFVGDSRGAAVYALALGDAPATGNAAPVDVSNVD